MNNLFFLIRVVLFGPLFISLLFFPSGCYRVNTQLEPQISYAVQDRYLKQLPSPFVPLSLFEKQTDWGKEYLIGMSFAKNLDFYRAITALRRAEILLAEPDSPRAQELSYAIILCYYLGKKYTEVETTFTQSSLPSAQPSFPPFKDLLLVLYDTYGQLKENQKQAAIFALITHHYPEEAKKLQLYTALSHADFANLHTLAASPAAPPSLLPALNSYEKGEKSPGVAALLNTVLPGAGYLYLGQKQTALTAVIFNGLFIAASVYFFKNGPIAAGIVTTSFEAGWYFGGIYGARMEAKLYNERLYERTINPIMNRERLFPIFRLSYAF